MSQFKVSTKNGQVTIQAKLGKNETINQNDMMVFQQKLIRGIMRPSVVGKQKLQYMAPAGIPLAQYLKRGVSKQDFFHVFVQILEITVKLEANKLNIRNLVLNMEYVFVNIATKEVQMVYQPIITQNPSANIFVFLYNVIQAAVLPVNTDMYVLHDLTRYMNQLQFFSAGKIEDYIEQLYPEIFKIIPRYKQGDSQNLREKQWETSHRMRANMDDDATTLLVEEGTMLLNAEDEEETTVLMEEKISYPYLIYSATGERIDINKPEFWIGKDRGSMDYAIPDNRAVSRRHAVIKSRGGNYFVMDNGSTNSTYVNNVKLREMQEVALSDGDKILLANENFEFHID